MAEFDPTECGSGTYDVPGVGLVVNGVLIDSPEAAEAAGYGRIADVADVSSDTSEPEDEPADDPAVVDDDDPSVEDADDSADDDTDTAQEA